MLNYNNYKVDFSNCDKEPIHFIGRIQPHGFLLVLNKETFVIEQVSENIGEFLPNTTPPNTLEKPFQRLLSKNDMGVRPENLCEPAKTNPDIITLGGKKFFGFAHESEGKIILECESYTDYPDTEKIRHSHILTQLFKQLNTLDKIESMGEVVAGVLQQILDYDRVDIMKFDKDSHSEVIAESLKKNIDSYLGHHFPATDIPKPARALLLQKSIRQIPDVNAEAVNIIPYYNPTTGTPTNILKSELRNPSEIHLEYVRNMNVNSTISFSILVRGKLWGIISCHKTEPSFIDFWKRQFCNLITQAFANAIAEVQEMRDVKQYNEFKNNKQVFIDKLEKYNDLASGFAQKDLNLLNITQGTGAALILDDGILTFGNSPSVSQVKDLIYWLTNHTDKKVFSTRELSKLYPEAEGYRDVASGLLALEISRYNKEFLLFFKPEITETRIWAGIPQKPTLGEGMHIHPRKSFSKWKEEIKGMSLSWSSNELEISQIFVKDLTAIRLRDQAAELTRLNMQLEATAQRLTNKNSQLRDFGLIMSHNLRGPMNNVLGLYSIYKEEPTEANTEFILEHIPGIMKNMLLTMSDLNVIIETRLDENLPLDEISLEKIIQKEWQNLIKTDEMRQKGAEINTQLQVSTLKLPKHYVESILHNFISNALKYRSPERLPLVLIKSWQEKGRVYLSVSDNGLGMELGVVGKDIFGLYKTFHQHENAKGLGLYLTKMQIEALGGQVSVQSKLNKGTTFTVTFPI